MSKYKEIQTEFRDGAMLLKALSDLGLKFEAAANLRSNETVLKTDWASRGETDHMAAVVVSRATLREAGVYSYGGLGFAWNGESYDLIQDSHNEGDVKTGELLGRLRQRYAYHVIQTQAHARGLTVRESRSVNGDIELVLVGYNRR